MRIAPGVEVVDISSQMPRHDSRRYGGRSPDAIRRLFVHHSGRLGAAGESGALNSARYVVRSKDFPGPAYHYWIPYDPVEPGRVIIYRCVPETVVCWHTGGRANRQGLGIALQGNTNTRWLSVHHMEAMEGLLPWLAERHQLEPGKGGLSWHAEAELWGGHPKPSCPGKHAVAWLQSYRELAHVA